MGNLKGVEQFKRHLESLDKKLQKTIIRKAMRAAAKVLADEIKANAPVDSGLLRRSVKVKAGPRRKHKIILVVEVSGGHDGPFVGFVELGTSSSRPTRSSVDRWTRSGTRSSTRSSPPSGPPSPGSIERGARVGRGLIESPIGGPG